MKIKELLDKPEKWTKRCFARDINGNSVEETDKDAICFCLLGATYKCYGKSDQFKTILAKLEKVVQVFEGDVFGPIAAFNDAPTTTFEDIKQLVEKLDI